MDKLLHLFILKRLGEIGLKPLELAGVRLPQIQATGDNHLGIGDQAPNFKACW